MESLVTFNPGNVTGDTSRGGVLVIGVQADGKILVGGNFQFAGGGPPKTLVRLNEDGTLESAATFTPVEGNASVQSLAIQTDGKILITGDFTTVNGQPRNKIARLHANGTLEDTSTFSASTGRGGLAAQPDGKILLWRYGTQNGGMARLNADGSLDPTFVPVMGANPAETECAIQLPDGRYLAGGNFQRTGGGSTYVWGLDTLRATGESEGLYLSFAGGTNYIYSIAGLADGRAFVGGYFSDLAGSARFLGLRGIDGNVTAYTTIPFTVDGVAVQADGRILIAGSFWLVNQVPRNGLARIFNGLAVQSIVITPGSKVQWLRSGSAPDVWQVSFERSTDLGVTWSPLGQGARVSGGWELAVNLPADAAIRARGRTTGGRNNSSTGLVEQQYNTPEIAVEAPAGTDLKDGQSTLDFGTVVSGSSAVKTVTIRNPGTVPLQSLAVSVGAGGNAGDFSVTQPASPTLAPGATATFTVTFSPGGSGPRTATVRVASNDLDENPFDITVTGKQATALEAWRVLHFDSPDNTGPGADLSDPDGDRMVNLLEFALGTDPEAWTLPPGQLVKNGGTLEFTYSRPTAALADVRYDLEASATISGAWGNTAQGEVILSDNGTTQQVMATYPAGITGERFVRLRVTRL